jgi:hypothetical protein
MILHKRRIVRRIIMKAWSSAAARAAQPRAAAALAVLNKLRGATPQETVCSNPRSSQEFACALRRPPPGAPTRPRPGRLDVARRVHLTLHGLALQVLRVLISQPTPFSKPPVNRFSINRFSTNRDPTVFQRPRGLLFDRTFSFSS